MNFRIFIIIGLLLFASLLQIQALAAYKSIDGVIVTGAKISRQLGFPTLNLEIVDDLNMQYGVYAGYMQYEGKIYRGVMNIGITPSFKVNKPKLEFHVFDFNQNLYGKEISVIPTHFIRSEMKFDDMSSLKKQIAQDCEMAKKLLNIDKK